MAVVAGSSTAVAGVTRTTVRPDAAGSATIRASTTFGSVPASTTTSCAWVAGTVTNSGPTAPGPKASESSS